MKKSTVVVEKISISDKKIEFQLDISGEITEAIKREVLFVVEYSENVQSVPKSVAIIPLLGNILPIVWVYDAELVIPVCDKAFYDSISDIKKGYQCMYPRIGFGGEIVVKTIEKNINNPGNGVLTFFSGGVDAFNTLVQHVDEKPTLFTLWGADIKLSDSEGWNRVEKHLASVTQDLNVDYITAKSNFRQFINESILDRKVKESGDKWWHGFQHGMGMITHAGPITYLLGKKVVYFAASFTAEDKGKVTCASDPTIDNNIVMCTTSVIHDGYEFTRQMKLHNITKFSKENSIPIKLRVCWQSDGGNNCCICEKCWRTMLGIIAEGSNPRDFGFDMSLEQLRVTTKSLIKSGNLAIGSLRYQPIQDAMKSRFTVDEIPKEIKPFYNLDLSILDRNNRRKLRAVSRVRKMRKQLLKIMSFFHE